MAADHPVFRKDFDALRELLACPACYGTLRLESDPGERVLCEECGRAYAVVDGIPVLIAERTDSALPQD